MRSLSSVANYNQKMMQKPDRLYIEENVKYYPLTEKIICKLAPISVEFVDDYRKIGEAKPFPKKAAEDKNSLALAEKRGEVLKSIGRMVEELFSALDSKKTNYIFLGTIKLHKLLVEAMRERFPKNQILLDELAPSVDGKYKYLKFKRVDVIER